jgi:hypothetical protein
MLPTADELVAGAVAATGLEDFGEAGWREGLDVLVDSLEAEADLNDIGVASFGDRLATYLRQRLELVALHREHPELAEEVIEGPLIITGLPRTGTTALSNLLAQDPETRSLLVWESGQPLPPPEAATYATDERIAAAQFGLDMLHELVPGIRVMHDDTATSTAESIDLLGMSFATHHFGGMARIPTYDRWWLAQDLRPAYHFARGVLQVLQWRCPPNRWHLKNPPDLFCLEAVVDAHPEVQFIWTHRDPAQVLASVSDLIATIVELSTVRLDRVELGGHLLDLWSEAVARGLAARDRLGEDRFVDVRVAELMADPVATVGRIYDEAGWPFTADAERGVAAWWAENPPGRHGRHEPDAAAFGLTPEGVRDRFADYLERFADE